MQWCQAWKALACYSPSFRSKIRDWNNLYQHTYFFRITFRYETFKIDIFMTEQYATFINIYTCIYVHIVQFKVQCTSISTYYLVYYYTYFLFELTQGTTDTVSVSVLADISVWPIRKMLYRYRFRYRPIQFSISVALPIQHNLILHGANVTFVLKILTLLLARHLNKLAN